MQSYTPVVSLAVAAISSGLHGVGSSVVNAPFTRMIAEAREER